MSNEQKIIDRILADAQKEADQILDTAKKEADAILAEAREKADKELDAYRTLAEAEAERAYQKEISGAEMEAKKQVLLKKQFLLEEVISEAEHTLLNMEDDEYIQTIGRMLKSIPKGKDCEIIVASQDADKLAPVISENGFTLSEERRDIARGFIVREKDIEYNYSFGAMIAIEREALEQEAAEILFGQRG